MVVYVQKKIDGKWCTLLHADESVSHRICIHLKKHSLEAEYRVAHNEGAT
jgi:hypothetical protein